MKRTLDELADEFDKGVILKLDFSGIMMEWGLIGVWAGLAIGRALAGALNFFFAQYAVRNLVKSFS